MSQPEQPQPVDIFKAAITAGLWALGLNQSLALLWMLPTNRWGSFGRRYLFVNVAIALLIFYPCMPILVPFTGPGQAEIYALGWYALLALACIHRFSSMVTGGRRHLFDVGYCPLGFGMELLAAVALGYAASIECPPLAACLGGGYVAKQLLLLSIDLRYRRIRDGINSPKYEAEEVTRTLRG